MAFSDQRYTDIRAGAERIRLEKPYENRDDAVAALDWLSAAVSDLRGAQKRLPAGEIVEITRLGADIDVLDGLSQAIATRMNANDQHVPGRHGGRTSGELDIDT